MVFTCPRCGSRLKITRLRGRKRYLVYCEVCRSALAVTPQIRGKTFAYYEFLERYETGEVRRLNDVLGILVDEGFIRAESEIVEMVEKSGLSIGELPEPIREILFSKSDFIVYYRIFDRNEEEMGPSVDELKVDPRIVRGLKDAGITRIYKFQHKAIKEILIGHDVVIVAPAGSGKTEAFSIPIFHKIAEERGLEFQPLISPAGRGIRALFIYPTKSLSRDQLLKLRRMGRYVGISVEVFDGDTTTSERRRICDEPPDILVTNFDMLHYHMSHKTGLRSLLESVRYVVVDELHEYTGAFGSNVHFVLRRLERICGRYQVIGSSATIANPGEFAELLFGRKVTVIETHRGRRGRVHFIMIYPSLRGHHVMIGDLVEVLSSHGWKTVVFSNSHVDAEVIKQVLDRRNVRCHVHRAGLGREERRRVEEEFRAGRLRVVSATSTLELGIDIGDLDAVITFPIGLARFLQRAGRAGRRGQDCAAILALKANDQISEYYRRNPEEYLSYIEPLYVEPRNPVVARYQLTAAAMDDPLGEDEFKEFKDVLSDLVREGFLRKIGKRYVPTSKGARAVTEYNIRGIGEVVGIYCDGRRIGEREMPMAMRELFPGAVYLHGGRKYRSISFEFSRGRRRAVVEPLSPDYPYRTDALRYAEPEVLETVIRRVVYGIEVIYCKVRIREVVEGYLLRHIYSGEIKDRVFLERPLAYTFETLGFVFRVPYPSSSLERAPIDVEDALLGSYHAVEHVVIESSGIYTGSGTREMGGISLGGTGLIFVYDGIPGGSGASLLLFKRLDLALKTALSIVEKCPCKRIDGCPKCTYSYGCGNNNTPLFRPGAVESLRRAIIGEKTTVHLEVGEEKPII